MSLSLPKIILASTSPRRRILLSLLGLPFEVVTHPFQEHSLAQTAPGEEALLFAEGKARSVSGRHPSALVIGSDTLIDFQGEKIGKPADRTSAVTMLRRLQGRSHLIWTAVCLIDARDGTREAAIEKIEVTMRAMRPAEVDAYVATGEPLDKAGAYAVQGEGRCFIRTIKGDLFAAIGLPLRPLANFLADRGVALPRSIDQIYHETPGHDQILS